MPVTRRPAPLILLAFGAGLATGLLHFGNPAGVALILLTAGAVLALRGIEWGALLLVAALGRCQAAGAWLEADAGCAARLPAARIEARLRLGELPDPAGGLIEVLPVAGCEGSITARWPAGDTLLAAGSTALVQGRWIPDSSQFGPPSGILLVESVVAEGGRPGAGDRLRNGVTRTIRSLYGGRAGIVEALVLNRRASMAPEWRQRYARSGLVHLLSISGFHVGLIAAWVLLLARPLLTRWGPPGAVLVAPLVAAFLAAWYVAFLGWPPPAARAALLVVIVAIERWRQRRVDADSLLTCIALLLLLADPWSIASLGAWLSFLSLWGASRAVRWSDAALAPHLVVRMLSGSIGATLATAPLTAAVLGMVSLAGVLLNLVAIPLAALTLPGVLASVLLGSIAPGMAAPLAAGSGLGLWGLDALAKLGSSIPGLAIVSEGGAGAALPWLALLVGVLWATGRRVRREIAVLRLAALAVAAVWGMLMFRLHDRVGARDDGLTLHFLDVGQGDAALVHTPAGQWVVIDAGPRGPGGDAGRDVVVPALERLGAGRVAALVLSHPHLDHIGGAAAVLSALPVKLVLDPGDPVADSVYLGLLDRLSSAGSEWRGALAGDTLVVDSARFTVLHPSPGWPERGLDLNEDSAVLRLEFAGCRVLFAGDAGFDAESAMGPGAGPIDLLKVGHHGSRGASGDQWLDQLRPAAAVISVGRRNRYGHPAPETLARLAAHGIPIWRTDLDGSVTVRVHDGMLDISARQGTKRMPCHSSDS